MDFISSLIGLIFFCSPFAFIAGIIVAVSNKDNVKKKKVGHIMIITSVIVFIIGFGMCLSAVNGSGFH